MASSTAAHPAAGQIQLRGALLAGACVVLPGFVTLALLGSLRHYTAGLPGFWDYPSGTIGDALLVPTIIVGLLLQAQALRKWRVSTERRWQLLGGVVGAVGGAAVPLSWYLDPHTSHIWMLPRAHHYLLAGWWHFGYLTASTALLGYLVVTVLGRLRRAPATGAGLPDGYSPTAMTFIVGAGLAMLMLIGRDAVAGGKTAASGTTIASLVVVAIIFLGGLAWTVGTIKWRLLATPATIVAAFLVGVLGIIVRWEPHDPVIIGIGALTAALACIAATSPLGSHPEHAQYRWPTAIAMWSIVTAGLIRSADSFLRGQSKPLLWLLAGVLLAFLLLFLVDRGRTDVHRAIRYSFFVGYCMFMYYLAVRIRSPAGEYSAGASVSAADIAFDVMVFTLIQTRFSDLSEADKDRVNAEFVSTPGEAAPPSAAPDADSGPSAVVTDMLFLGVAVGLSLFMLLVMAAGPLGLDRSAVDIPTVRVLLLLGTVAVGMLAWLSDYLLRRWRAREGEPPNDSQLLHHGLYLPSWFGVAAFAAAGVWAATLLALSGGPVHLPLLASLAAVVVFTFAMRTLLSTTVLLQMLKPTVGQITLCFAAAVSAALGAFWFISMGIWQGTHPLRGAWLAGTTTCIFAGTTIVYVAAGLALTTGLPQARRPTQYVLSRDALRGYVKLDGINLGIVFLIGVGLPLYAATRDQELHASALNVVASMVFLPGLISAVFWGLHNWHNWEELNVRASHKGVARPTLALTDDDWQQAGALDARRTKRFRTHVRLNRYSMIALMACGLTYLADIMLR